MCRRVTSNSELWLIVESTSTSPPKVQIAITAPTPNSDPITALRFSPIYPILPERLTLPSPADTYYIGFFILRRAAAGLARLAADQQTGVCIGLGLASIIVIKEQHSDIETYETLWASDLVASETWKVVNEQCEDIHPRLSEPSTLPQGAYEVRNSSSDTDVTWLILELRHNLRRFAALSAQYIPTNIQRCEIWVSSIEEILDDLSELIGASDSGSSGDNLQRQKLAHANSEVLIHINSALVYAISQAFHGALPIHETLPLVSQHSLLGIGTAWLGLRNLCSFIESVFSRFPVPVVVERQFAALPWRELPLHSAKAFDYKTESVQQQPTALIRPKITLFSSRLGFGESDFTATCAAQTLHAASAARHNMMTMSHELLHAHVKALVIAIFSANDAESVEEGMAAAHQEWLRWHKEQFDKKELRLIHTIRFSIVEFVGEYQYCLRRAEAVRATGKPPVESSGDVAVPAVSHEFVIAFRASYRFFEEVLVHTLDFHYFYGGQADVYVDAIWSSWSTVPSVLSRLEWYILRTLAPLATVIAPDSDNHTYCFEQAIALLKSRLTELGKVTPNRTVAEAALRMLEDERIQHWLLTMFVPTLRVADLTAKLLMDNQISNALWEGDEAIDWDDREERMSYLLETFTFEERKLRNPVAFLVDRLMRALRSPARTSDEGRDSAWIHLVMSDHEIPNTTI
jgi:hypothetical protein